MKLIKDLYDDLFRELRTNHINIFLCGGASKGKDISVRDELRKNLEQKNKTHNIYHIYYPEDLIVHLLKRKSDDLLTLEKFLANNADLICIVCESPGSFVELGAFTNSLDTRDKVIAILKKKHKHDKSFINLGPVRYLKKNDEHSVIYFNSINDLYTTLLKKIQHKRDFAYHRPLKDINTIEGLRVFILLMLYFYKEYDVSKLPKDIKEGINEYLDDIVYEKLYNASLKDLYNDKMILKTHMNSGSIYRLTDKGMLYVDGLLRFGEDLQRAKLCDKIRLRILANQFYTVPIQ